MQTDRSGESELIEDEMHGVSSFFYLKRLEEKMNTERLKNLLAEVKSGQTSIDIAFEKIKDISYHDLEYAKIDYHRELRNGFPEVVYNPGKSLEQIWHCQGYD